MDGVVLTFGGVEMRGIGCRSALSAVMMMLGRFVFDEVVRKLHRALLSAQVGPTVITSVVGHVFAFLGGQVLHTGLPSMTL